MRSSSSIISTFIAQQQDLQLDNAKKIFDEMAVDIKKRREKILQKQGKQPVVQEKEKQGDASKAEKFKSMDEHRIPIEELLTRLETDKENGLTTAVAQRKLQVEGRNVLSEKKKVPWFVKLFHEMTGMFSLMLWAGSALCFLAYGLDQSDPSNLYLGIVLAIVVFITGIVTFFQNAKSEAIMEAFKNFIPPTTLVIRDGKKQQIQAEQLVTGDLIVIENGKRIPADIRITVSNDMKVDNSSLTGESLLLLRTTECTHENNPLETKNLAFFGTLCKEGNGVGIVVFTGDRTVIGQIANLASSSGGEETPLRRELNLFIKMISIIAVSIGVLFFCLGFILKYSHYSFQFLSFLIGAITNLVFAIGIIVANVPEGLLATITVGLSLTAKRLSLEKVLVKNLEGVETLGSTSCICSDKTGTLTQNKMTVENLWYDNLKRKGHNRQKMQFDKFKNYEYNLNEQGFKMLQECTACCSEALFDTQLPQEQLMRLQNQKGLTPEQKEFKINEERAKWQENLEKIPWLDRPTTGDASESALIKFLQPIEDIEKTRAKFPLALDKDSKPAKMPFNSTNKYAFLIVKYDTIDSHYCLFTKGAPERIWGLCTKVYNKGNPEEKNDEWNKRFDQINQNFGKNGERVLGFAKYHLPKDKYPLNYLFDVQKMNFPFNDQTFIGLISLIDPPKDNVPYAVIKCKTAGIQVIMVTGDQPVTAAAIAKQCNIITEKSANEIMEEEHISFEEACKKSNAIVIHGDRLTKMAIDDEGLPESEKGRLLSDWLEKPQVVFARTSPAQKLIIVTGCQKKGHIVAVTGDGVNDSPAIKKADIGVAMGITGSDVAKDAADMILLNDDFASIVIGIEEGRKIFDNLKKTITYVLTSNIPELIPFLSFIIFQLPLPLSTVLILWVDLGTDMIPSVAFVFEESELDIMTRKPRNQEEHLVSGKLMVFAYTQSGWIQTCGGYLQYFIILNDFGIPGSSAFYLNNKYGIKPEDTDQYDPASPWLGNSNLKKKYLARLADPTLKGQKGIYCTKDEENEFEMVDWLFRLFEFYDLRQTVVFCDKETNKWKENVEWGDCIMNQVSPITQRPVCWHTDSLKYAQTGFFFSIVLSQVCNFISCKTIKLSALYQGMKNPVCFFAYATEMIVLWLLAYVKPFNIVFGTRDLIFPHFGMCGLVFCPLLIIWNEIRKFFVKQTNYQTTPQRNQTIQIGGQDVLFFDY